MTSGSRTGSDLGSVIINLNEVDGQTNSGFFNTGDNGCTSPDVGQINAKLKFNREAPYFELGFNNPIKRKDHPGAFFNLGTLCHGKPLATLTTTKTVPQLQVDIDKELQKANDDIRSVQIFSILKLGLSYRLSSLIPKSLIRN